jgi:hypothetical protein
LQVGKFSGFAGGVVADARGAKSASSAVDALGQDFYKVILENEPFKSTKVTCGLLFVLAISDFNAFCGPQGKFWVLLYRV